MLHQRNLKAPVRVFYTIQWQPDQSSSVLREEGIPFAWRHNWSLQNPSPIYLNPGYPYEEYSRQRDRLVLSLCCRWTRNSQESSRAGVETGNSIQVWVQMSPHEKTLPNNSISNCKYPLDHWKSKRVPEKHLLLLYWLRQSLWQCGSQQTGKLFKRWEYQTTWPAS